MQNSSARLIAARTACKPSCWFTHGHFTCPDTPLCSPLTAVYPSAAQHDDWMLKERRGRARNNGQTEMLQLATLEHRTTELGGLPISPGGTVAVFAVPCYLWLISCEHRAAIKSLLASGGGSWRQRYLSICCLRGTGVLLCDCVSQHNIFVSWFPNATLGSLT